MKTRQLLNLGIPAGAPAHLAQACVRAAFDAGWSRETIRVRLREVVEDPEGGRNDPLFGELAALLGQPAEVRFDQRSEPAPWRQWGDDLDATAVQQMRNACALPVAVQGALMADAHVGYGLPIGGVLATDNAVIPYAVGVDIACRMMLTITDIPVKLLKGEKERLSKVLCQETRFGIGAKFSIPREHPVMDEDWGVSKEVAKLKEKARLQLGTSGSGNHFVEFGILTLARPELGLATGTYLAILSHSGSRGAGAAIASTYSRLALDLHPELPKQLRQLAWLDLDSGPGSEYWAAMELMGRYASANHHVMHRELVRALRTKVLAQVENHHNFAWKETHGGREVVVHRKGATPAGDGVLGIIPGSMASPAFVVRGRGEPQSLRSAAHGAGRVMSRKQARLSFTWSETRKLLEERGVTLLSAGLDEVPGVYKDIETVMAAQRDLVEAIARFDPKIVKMAPDGEQPED